MDYLLSAGERDVITVAETGEFIQKAKKLLTDDERQSLIAYLSAHPFDGQVMEGTGGIRKLRWARQGQVKAVVSGLSISSTMKEYLCTL